MMCDTDLRIEDTNHNGHVDSEDTVFIPNYQEGITINKLFSMSDEDLEKWYNEHSQNDKNN